jgi:hypothetical protein
LRKYLIAGVAAFTAVAFAAVSYAQEPAAEMTVAVSPSKAGTKKKPKDVVVDLEIVNGDITQTASRIEIWLPKNVKIDTAGFKRCSLGVLGSQGPGGCPRASKVGSGKAVARAGVNVSPTPPTLPFIVNAYVTGSKSIAFHLQQEGGAIVAVAPAKIARASGKYGQKLDVSIPEQPAQQYPKGNYNGLEKLDVALGSKRRGRSVAVSTGCVARKHPYKAAITFVNNPNPPKAAKVETETTARCSK